MTPFFLRMRDEFDNPVFVNVPSVFCFKHSEESHSNTMVIMNSGDVLKVKDDIEDIFRRIPGEWQNLFPKQTY